MKHCYVVFEPLKTGTVVTGYSLLGGSDRATKKNAITFFQQTIQPSKPTEARMVNVHVWNFCNKLLQITSKPITLSVKPAVEPAK